VSLTVAVSADGQRVPVAAAHLAAVAKQVLRSEGITHALLSIAFVSSSKISSMNRRHIGKSGSTDVIAFSLAQSANPVATIGDVYISVDVARRNAKRLHLPVRQEIVRLLIHGTLHVLGYTHPDGEQRFSSAMWMKQESLLRRSRSLRGAK
jgi:probable rRNA maturation factor